MASDQIECVVPAEATGNHDEKIHIYIYTFILLYLFTYIHMYIYTYIHVYANIYIYIIVNLAPDSK